MTLSAQRKNHILTFALPNQKDQLISLNDCLFSFGKEKRSSAYCKQSFIHPQIINWQKEDGRDHSDFHIIAEMDLCAPQVKVKTDNQEISAKFRETVQSKINIDISDTKQQTQFETVNPEYADTALIQIFGKQVRFIFIQY